MTIAHKGLMVEVMGHRSSVNCFNFCNVNCFNVMFRLHYMCRAYKRGLLLHIFCHGLCDCLLCRNIGEPCKTAEPIEMTFACGLG